MTPIAAAIIKALVLPPGLNILLFYVAFAMLRRKPRVAMSLMAFAALLLYAFSIPLVARPLAGIVEQHAAPLDLNSLPSAEAIVVLGCDRYSGAPEYGRDDASPCALVRLRYAAELHARTGLPVLLSGGTPLGEQIPEAELMERVLRERFGITARWLEGESRNTAENATYSAAMLNGEGVQRIFLVTHALHMERARRAFARTGLDVITAPTYYQSTQDQRPGWFALLPMMGALMISNQAMYELLGLAWYEWRSIWI